MRKEIQSVLLTAGMVVGVGAPIHAQEAQSPPPIVEASDAFKEEVFEFIEDMSRRVDFNAEPRFFNQMERRADNDPDKFFSRVDLPAAKGDQNNYLFMYYPDGLTSTPRIGFRQTTALFVGNLDNGVPTGINFGVETEDYFLEVGKDGTLAGEQSTDLFNHDQIKRLTQRYIKEPKALRDEEWTEYGYQGASMVSMGNPAKDQKLHLETEELIEGNEALREGWLMTGDQNGSINLSHYKMTILD